MIDASRCQHLGRFRRQPDLVRAMEQTPGIGFEPVAAELTSGSFGLTLTRAGVYCSTTPETFINALIARASTGFTRW
jgi:hypothetical protein